FFVSSQHKTSNMESKNNGIIEIGEGWACALQIPAIHCYHREKLVRELPVSLLTECVPFNHNVVKEGKKASGDPLSIDGVPEPKSLIKAALLINSQLKKATQPANAYVITAEADAPSLVIAVGGNSRHESYDSELANMVATAEASQNLACTGATPVAFFKFPASSDASPHPTLGLVGLLPKEAPHVGLAFQKKGEMIYLLGRSVQDVASSEYLYSVHHIHPSPAPWMNPQEQSRLQSVLSEAIRKNLLTSIHSITKGGIFTALLQSSIPNQLGFDITTDAEIREDAFLFGESLGRFIVSTSEHNDVAFVDMMTKHKIPVTTLGHTTKGEIRVDDISYGFIRDFM
ncbi:MAG: AIR synthase-related protein, partial [Bacteroidales bacterium]|nr:AIR synthase-related protein [Bacteroidales bacterium]